MADYEIIPKDVEEAAALVRDILRTEKPDRDYSEGSVAGDVVVDGHAIPFAYLRNQINKVVARLSLRDISKLGDEESVRDAADAILSNLLVTRAPGTFARGPVTIHLTQKVDILVPRRARFFKTSDTVFYLDAPTDRLISASELSPSIDASGAIVDYAVNVNVVAANIGASYNLPPGRLYAIDNISPFLSYGENVSSFTFGNDQQSTQDVVASAENAMALRAMVNARSNAAVLRGVDPGLQALLTVGYGDPEMQRDLVLDPATGVKLHVGGHVDIYLRLETQEVVERMTINALAQRPDGLVAILRDTAPPTGSFITAGVVPGDVLVLAADIPEAPFQFVVRGVRALELDISSRVPFTRATDEMTVIPALTYTVGDNYPSFNDKVTRGPTTDATTSRRFKEYNRALLPGGPVYRVKTVEIVNPPSALDPYRDPSTGRVLFTERLNGPPPAPPGAGDPLSYYLAPKNPLLAQTQRSVTPIEVGWAAFDFSGLTLEVTYDTLAGFSTLAAYVVDDFNRVAAANALAKGFHPVYVSTTVTYRGRVVPRNAAELLSGSGTTYDVDETAIKQGVVDAVNAPSQGVVPDAGALATAAQDADPNVAAIYPLTVLYDLLAPDGKVYSYSSPDVVTLFPDGSTGATLLNPTDVGLPATGYEGALQQRLLGLGVSDRTVRYLASLDDVVLEKRGP